MQNVKLVMLFLVMFASSSCTNTGRFGKNELTLNCSTLKEDDILVIVHYFTDDKGDEGPLLDSACGGKNHPAKVINHRKVEVYKPDKSSVVHMHVQLDSSLADAGLAWRIDDPVWMNDRAVVGEVPTRDSWCGGSKPSVTPVGADLAFDLCSYEQEKRQGIELRLKSTNPMLSDRDIRVDPQIVHKPNVLRE